MAAGGSCRHLMPQMQRRTTMRESIPQIMLVAAGVVIALFLVGQH
jgi:zinc and cadmium transporter